VGAFSIGSMIGRGDEIVGVLPEQDYV